MTIDMNYVDSIVREESGKDQSDEGEFTSCCGEDSSYDSDFEAEDTRPHEDVSRTASDTLGAEFAEYVNSDYNARVGFALKLGYTEKQVQASLLKLGPNPGQNELLEELIKLGAQAPRLPESECDDAHETVAKNTWGATLRPIVIDGSNVAMSHGNKEVFSCRGIKICVDWFRNRGHQTITVFVPKWRKEASKPDNPVVESEILNDLEREGILVYTPSRVVGGKRIVCYDDRFILRLAVENDGIVVSNDNYRDLIQENAEFKRVVEERTLMYSFVNDRFMPPDDPLGRNGPTLDAFLRTPHTPPPPCPYGRKCTYGNKCKYHHPERGPVHKSVTERLSEHAQRHWLARGCDGGPPSGDKGLKGSLSVPLSGGGSSGGKMALARTRSGVGVSPAAFEERVSKSKSVENMRNMYYPYHSHIPSHTPSPPSSTASDHLPENLHRKLQRQLTLNPSYDPRLYEMRLTMGCASNWGDHPGVTRIASAPDPSGAAPMSPMTPQMFSPTIHSAHVSASDPQLHLPATQNLQMAEARRKLHYHLASLFPEEQVLAAMQRFPEETKPQAICAAILTMFPST